MLLLKDTYILSYIHTYACSDMKEVKRQSLGKVRENFKKSRETQNMKTREK